MPPGNVSIEAMLITMPLEPFGLLPEEQTLEIGTAHYAPIILDIINRAIATDDPDIVNENIYTVEVFRFQQ